MAWLVSEANLAVGAAGFWILPEPVRKQVAILLAHSLFIFFMLA